MFQQDTYSPLYRSKVLIVDDAPSSSNLLASVLGAAGCLVVQAASATEARNKLKESLPDLICLDILLPDQDGYSLCLELKSSPPTKDLPVIFVSALSALSDKVKGFSVGGADYLCKPFEATEVVARLAQHLRLLRLQRELAQERDLLSQKRAELVLAHQQAEAIFGLLTRNGGRRELDGKYLLEEQIGSGGYAVVFRAIRLATNETVAIKILRPSEMPSKERRRKQLLQESFSACRVVHPNAALILDFGTSPQGMDYLVMEHLTGRTLGEELRASRPLTLTRVLQIVIPVCRVLIQAHQAGIVHRDIKPDNIFLHWTPDGEVVKVLDFGIAKIIQSDDVTRAALQTTGGIVGTPLYMSPEQLRGDPCDGQADVYATGVMCYEMLSECDWKNSQRNLFTAILEQMSSPASCLDISSHLVPEPVESVLRPTLAFAPRHRPTAHELLTRLLGAARTVLGDVLIDELLSR